MGETVNLRTARKQAKRQNADREAAANRLVHGRSKAERKLERAKADKAVRAIEQHRIDTGDAT